MSTPTENNNIYSRRLRSRQRIFENVLFAMFAALMLVSKLLMEVLPNMHLLGMFTVLLTVLFRFKALIPIYLYVLLNGLYAGFDMWWVPYLYIWALLWGMAMLLPKNMPKPVAAVVYPTLCAVHGFIFGILYAPAQAVMLGLDLQQTLVWIASGIPFDIIHGISNFAAGMLVLPLELLIRRLMLRRN